MFYDSYGLRWYAKKILYYCKRNTDSVTYKKVEASLNKVHKYTLIVTVIFFVILIGIMFAASSVPRSNEPVSDIWKYGRVSRNTVWYINNDKCEINLSDYGYNPVDYSDNDKFIVYLNEEGSVLNIFPGDEPLSDAVLCVLIAIGGGVFFLLFVFCIHIPIALHTYGKAWHAFGRWYHKRGSGQGTFVLDEWL